MELDSGIEGVQFVDGDCEIVYGVDWQGGGGDECEAARGCGLWAKAGEVSGAFDLQQVV